jgi:predicted HicB family RNase H-like nuclease
METTTKSLSGTMQLRISPRQKAFIMLESSRKKLTPSTYLRNLINIKISEDAK